jgi:hypothetical protein
MEMLMGDVHHVDLEIAEAIVSHWKDLLLISIKN